MFSEKLKNDLDGIHPRKDVLNNITKMMQEEAQKPREPKHVPFVRYGGMAAAICMIAVGAIALSGNDKISTESMPESRIVGDGIAPASIDGNEYKTVYKGRSIDLSDEQTAEIVAIGRKYAEENPMQMINLMLSVETAEEMGEEGLYFAYDDGEYMGIYIDDDDSYLCCGQSTYWFGGEEKDKVLAYFK